MSALPDPTPPSRQDRLRAVGVGVLLAGLMLWLATSVSDPLSEAWGRVQDHQGGAVARLMVGLFPLLAGVFVLARADRLTPARRDLPLYATAALLILQMGERALRETGTAKEELSFFQVTWAMADHQLAYHDFFENHQMFWYALFVPIFRLMANDLRIVLVIRSLMFLIVLALVAATGWLARRFGGRALTSSVLMLSMPLCLEFRPDFSAALFALLSFNWLWGSRRPGRALVAGLLMGIAVLISVKSVFHALSLALGALIGALEVTDLLIWAGVTAAVAFLGVIWAWVEGILSDYWACSVAYNKLYALDQLSVSFWHSNAMLELEGGMGHWPLLVLLVPLGAGALLARGKVERCAWSVPPAALAATGYCLYFRFSYNRYFALALALEMAIAAIGMSALQKEGKGLLAAAPTVALLFFGGVSLLRVAADPPTGYDLVDNAIALANCPDGARFYGEDFADYRATPIFRLHSDYYMSAQSFNAGQYERHHVTPLRYPPLDAPLAEHPPAVMAVDDPVRAQKYFDELSRVGAHYHLIAPRLWALDR